MRMRPEMPVEPSEEREVEDLERPRAFTPGWSQSLEMVDGLPIKTKSGKIVRTHRPKPRKQEDSEASGDEDPEEGHIAPPEEDIDEDEPIADSDLMDEDVDIARIKVEIADICNSILANPQSALVSGKSEDEPILRPRRINELLKMLEQHTNLHVKELVMLSLLLLFKDICPSYFIRIQPEADNVKLKKETQKLLDYDKALLKSYQRFLRFLEGSEQSLGANCAEDMSWGPKERLGLSALRCMCELLRSLPFFNFRSQLLKVIVSRAAQRNEDVGQLCSDTLIQVFRHDITGDVSYEAVRLIAGTLANCKYSVPSRFLKCLEHVQLNVHEDNARTVRQKVKREKRKRKRADDDVLDGLAEGDLSLDRLSSQRFQADSLHEICLTYFRVVKMKVGFDLLPLALEGLSRISHLINLETVEDLILVMRSVLDNTAVSLTPSIKLMCVKCALKTLCGPGEILNYDYDVFTTATLDLLQQVYGDFDGWPAALECIDFMLVKRREARNTTVIAFVRLLLLQVPHVSLSVAVQILCMVNTILLRYPRARSSVVAISNETKLNAGMEDEVVDLAMAPLKVSQNSVADPEDDGSWIFSLLVHHIDKKLSSVATKVVSKNIVTSIPFRLAEVRFDEEMMADLIDTALASTPSQRERRAEAVSKSKGRGRRR